MRPHFARLISIEMAPAIYEAARRRFAGDARVELLLGDSAIAPAERAGDAESRRHCSGWTGTTWAATTARADQDSPVRAELAALLRHPVRGTWS